MATVDLYPYFKQDLESLALPPGQQLVVALGGGVDSQTILDLTDRFRQDHPEYRYLAIHLDHAFHEKSLQWAEFLRQDCQKRNFPAIVEPIQVVQGARESLEEVGRDLRYLGLKERTEPHAVILLGQHQSDQIETFFLQLKRGSGPKGLACMAKLSYLDATRRLFRPLLQHSKQELYQYGEAFDVQWIEDDMNYDTRVERNFLRHDIIPRLQKRWPSIEKTVARSAALCAEQQEVLELLLDNKLLVLQEDDRLRLKGWQEQPEPLQAALLRRWIERQGARLPSAAVLSELLQQLSRLPQGQIGVQWGQWRVTRQKQHLILVAL